MSMSEVIYSVVEYGGIYEILRVDGTHNFAIVQTNLRTKEKAIEACKIWQQRELNRKLESLGSTTSTLRAIKSPPL